MKLIKSSCVLYNLLMLMKLGWNISYFDRPFIFYEKKLFSVALKMRSHNTIFHLIFNRLSQVSRLELIVEVVTYDTILQSIFDYNLYSIYLLYRKKSLQCHDFHQRVDWKSEALQIFSRLQTLWSPFDLDYHTVLF